MNKDKWLETVNKADAYDDLIIHTKGFMYDSLVYRFKDYQSRAFPIEVIDYKHKYNCSEIDARERIQDRHDRDLMRFVQILDEAIGEHD